MNTKGTNILLTAGLTLIILAISAGVSAHDGWVQTNISRTNVGDMVYIDLMFGNHGNMHRDYKIHQSKWDKTKSTFWLHIPDGNVVDFNDSVVDVGADVTQSLAGGTVTYVDKNGYLVSSFIADQNGIYIVDAVQDTVVSYAPERSIKCAKAIIGIVPPSLEGNYAAVLSGYDRNLNQVFEIIPKNDPTNLAVGDTLTFQVMFKGEPLADAEVSVIPRGKTLPEMGDPNSTYDFMTDPNGMVSYTFDEANYHLIVAHKDTDEAGTLYDKTYTNTKYTADLTAIVRPAKKQLPDPNSI